MIIALAFICAVSSLIFTDLAALASKTAEGVAPTASWQVLLDRAEPLYTRSDYKDALPLYVQAIQAVTTADGAPTDQIHCLRYLADCYCRLNEPDKALAQYEQVDALLPANDTSNRATNLNDEALCFGLREDYAKGESLCRAALKLCTDSNSETKSERLWQTARTQAHLGYFNYIRSKYALAIPFFQEAERTLDASGRTDIGSYYHLKSFDEAYQQFKRLYDMDVRLFGKTDLQTAKINRYIFGNRSTPADLQDLQEPLCKESSNLVNTHDPRSLYARPFTDAPGRVWLNPHVQQKGLVIAIHGLSLQHSSYDAFARKLADSGFCTVAFDMRGFGAYRQALGAEHLDFDGCMRDLKLVVSAIRADNPDRPLYILGESMGGAIALQFAAQTPELVDGLIASVPAGKRL